MPQPHQKIFNVLIGSLPWLLLLAGLTACAGGATALRNGYPDGSTTRSLPAAPMPEQLDWMRQPFSVHGETVTLNYSQAVLSLDIVRPDEDEKELDAVLTRLYPDMASALRAADSAGQDVLPSIDQLDVYQKYTDDRVLAALEQELSTGDLVYPGGKMQWLRDLLETIPRDTDMARRRARAFLATAIRLGGGSLELTPQVQLISARMLSRFEASAAFSTVTGFYSGSAELSAICRRDRFLQGQAGMGALASAWFDTEEPAEQLALMQEIDNALSGSIVLRDAYNDFLAIQAIATNPAAVASLNRLHEVSGPVAIFPHARSLEEQLFSLVPPGNPMETLKQALISGSAELSPSSDSGWYDHQQYALESLLLPERGPEFAKLAMSPSYVARLEQAFEATITQRRESQSKNLPLVAGSVLPLEEQPLLHLEPAPTVYLRTARAYGFLLEGLSALPSAAAGNAQLEWLLAEISTARRRYYAMHCLSCSDIGQPLGLTPQELDALGELATAPATDGALAPDGITADPRLATQQRQIVAGLLDEAALWLAQAAGDDQVAVPSLAYDPRVSVAVSMDESGVHNWGVIGVRLLLLEHGFSTLPAVLADDPQSQDAVQADVAALLGTQQRRLLPVYEYVSFSTAAPLSREQFRSWCDQSRSREEFLLVVNAYGGSVGRSWLEQYGIWVILLICLALFRDRLFPGIFGPRAAAADESGLDGTAPPTAE